MTDFEYRPGCPDDLLLIQSWVDAFTYKPGWRIDLRVDGYTTFTLHFSFPAPTSDHPHSETFIQVSYVLDREVILMIQEGYLEEAKVAFIQIVVDAIRRIELHEALEWLRFEDAVERPSP